MQNNNPRNYPQEEEISLSEILLLLFDSKIIIIVITSITILISLFFNYIKPPVFESNAKIIIGSYLETNKNGQESFIQIQTIKDIRSELLFNFDSDVKPIGEKFFSLKITGSSFDSAEKEVVEIVEFVKNRSEELINEKIEQDKLNLFKIQAQIKSTNDELSRLFSLKNLPNTDSRKDVYLSQLNVKLDALKLEKGVLERKLNKPDLFNNTRLYGEINTSSRNPQHHRMALFGTLIGLSFSIVFVFIRRSFKKSY